MLIPNDIRSRLIVEDLRPCPVCGNMPQFKQIEYLGVMGHLCMCFEGHDNVEFDYIKMTMIEAAEVWNKRVKENKVMRDGKTYPFGS